MASDAKFAVRLAWVLRLTRRVFDEICDLAIREYPLEACGLIAGPPSIGGEAVEVLGFYPCRNTAESAKLYVIDPKDHLRAELDADDHDWEILGVVHSHTHTEPFPSPTDIAQAPVAEWHYAIVSLKRDAPELRSYRILDNTVTEEPVGFLD